MVAASFLFALSASTSGDIQGVWESPSFGSGYVSLLKNSSTEGWHGWKKPTAPKGWKVTNGELAYTPGIESGDLTTNEQYADFDLQLEWKIQPGGNSGIIYRCTDDQDYCWRTGAEYQILDNEGGNDNGLTKYSAGANYDLFAPTKATAKKVGEWNQTRLTANGNHVTHYLNGVKVVEYSVGDSEWTQRLNASKFKTMPGYGVKKSGFIALQDHGYKVWFRKIRIKRL